MVVRKRHGLRIWPKSLWGKAGFLILAATGLFVAGLFIYPDMDVLRKKNPGQTSFMTHAERKAKAQGKKFHITQKWVPLSRVSPYLASAVLIGEDDKFYMHEGFDFGAIWEALEKDIKAGRLKVGGSTISQQLVKNLYLSPSKNPLRKLIEAVWTWRMERALTKKRILEIYLNVAEWGDGIYGIEAAAWRYYGKPASEIDASEAARLAAVLPNPRRYSPIGDSKYVENRSRIIHAVMQRRGIISDEYEDATSAVAPSAPDKAMLNTPNTE